MEAESLEERAGGQLRRRGRLLERERYTLAPVPRVGATRPLRSPDPGRRQLVGRDRLGGGRTGSFRWLSTCRTEKDGEGMREGGDQPHGLAAARADEREVVVAPGQQDGPAG